MLVSPAGRTIVPQVATVAGRPVENSTVAIMARTFKIGKDVAGGGLGNEKATFFGDFAVTTIDTGTAPGPLDSGDIVIGDVNAFGDIRLTVPSDGGGGAQIGIITRNVGKALEFNGRKATDFGVDLVAKEMIDFSETPVEVAGVPNGQEQPIFSSPGGDHDPTGDGGILSSFINRDFGTFPSLFLQMLVAVPSMSLPVGTILDLTPVEPSIANVSEAIAAAIPRPAQSGDVIRDTSVGRVQQESIVEMGIIPRDLNEAELLWLLSNRRFYNDMAGELAPDVREVSANRLSYSSVEQVLLAYKELFYDEQADEVSGTMELVSKRDALKAAMQAVYDSFMASNQTFTVEGFRSHIEQTVQHTLAADIIVGLQNLFAKTANLALAPNEMAAVKRRVYGFVAPEAVSTEQMDELVSGGISKEARDAQEE